MSMFEDHEPGDEGREADDLEGLNPPDDAAEGRSELPHDAVSIDPSPSRDAPATDDAALTPSAEEIAHARQVLAAAHQEPSGMDTPPTPADMGTPAPQPSLSGATQGAGEQPVVDGGQVAAPDAQQPMAGAPAVTAPAPGGGAAPADAAAAAGGTAAPVAEGEPPPAAGENPQEALEKAKATGEDAQLLSQIAEARHATAMGIIGNMR